MKNTLHQVAVVLSILITLVVNTLANILPINGLQTGQVSDRFQVYFVPAGYVFSIWGLIYIGMVAYGIFQALPSQRDNPRLRKIGWWAALSGLANSAWIFLWHYEQFALTVLVMLILLATLIVIFLNLQNGSVSITPAEKWTVHIPFSVYLGWISVATVANITSFLDYVHWDGLGFPPEVWMGVLLAIVFILTAAMLFRHRNIPFVLVILWALVGIAVKHSQTPPVVVPTWITVVLVAGMLGYITIRRKGVNNPLAHI